MSLVEPCFLRDSSRMCRPAIPRLSPSFVSSPPNPITTRKYVPTPSIQFPSPLTIFCTSSSAVQRPSSHQHCHSHRSTYHTQHLPSPTPRPSRHRGLQASTTSSRSPRSRRHTRSPTRRRRLRSGARNHCNSRDSRSRTIGTRCCL